MSAHSERRRASAAEAQRLPGWLPPVVLVLLATLAYGHAMQAPFILDDMPSIVQNPIERMLNPPVMATQETSLEGRPMVAITVWLNRWWSGMQPDDYHLFNLACHVINAWLLYGLVWQGLKAAPAALPLRKHAGWIALIAAVLWLVHPLQTEAVTYIMGRTELMLASFYLATLLCAHNAWEGPRRGWWAGAAVACCALGMATKEVMVTAPVMVVAWDLALREVPLRQLWAHRGRLYLALAATWLVLAALMIYQPRTDSVGFGSSITPWHYLAAQTEAWLIYAQRAIVPLGLCFDYGYVVVPPPSVQIAGGLLLAALLVVAAWGWLRCRWVGLLVTWPMLILAPTSSVVPIFTQVAAERRMYLPLVAVIVAGVLAASWTIRRLTARTRRPAARRWLACGTALALIATLTFLSWQRNALYAVPERLWRDNVARRPENPRAWQLLGDQLLVSGDRAKLEEAAACHRRSLELRPDYPVVYNSLGVALFSLGEREEAVAAYRRALELSPKYTHCYHNLARALASLERYDEARQTYQRMLEVSPNYATGLGDYGLFLFQRGDPGAAVEPLTHAAELEPDSLPIRHSLAVVLEAAGDERGALEQLRENARRHPRQPEVWFHLAQFLAPRGASQQAIDCLRKVLRLVPKESRQHAAILQEIEQLQAAATRP